MNLLNKQLIFPFMLQSSTRQLKNCKQQCMVDSSCLQLSNRVPHWLNRTPGELWKSILWLDRLPRLCMCHLCMSLCVAWRVLGMSLSFANKSVSASHAWWLACVGWGHSLIMKISLPACGPGSFFPTHFLNCLILQSIEWFEILQILVKIPIISDIGWHKWSSTLMWLRQRLGFIVGLTLCQNWIGLFI